MWLMSLKGFYSAVEHREDSTLLVVRSRDYGDASRFAQFMATLTDNVDDPTDLIITYRSADYPWRVIAPREVWSRWCAEEANLIDYGNFKSAVEHRVSALRARVYGNVWAALLRLEDLDPNYSSSSFNSIDAALNKVWASAAECKCASCLEVNIFARGYCQECFDRACDSDESNH